MFSPNGRILATTGGAGDGTTYLWDARTRRRLQALPDPHSIGVSTVSFSPGGRILAAADSDGGTYLWGVATGRLLAVLPGSSSLSVLTAEFSPVGLTVATCDSRGHVVLWPITERQVPG